jgi:hypothetical protein
MQALIASLLQKKRKCSILVSPEKSSPKMAHLHCWGDDLEILAAGLRLLRRPSSYYSNAAVMAAVKD